MACCKYDGIAAVCCEPLVERKVFEYIFQTRKFDTYVCKNAVYEVKLFGGIWFTLNSLNDIRQGLKGYYIINPFSGEFVYLNKENIRIICGAGGSKTCKVNEPYVLKAHV